MQRFVALHDDRSLKFLHRIKHLRSEDVETLAGRFENEPKPPYPRNYEGELPEETFVDC